MSAAFPLLSIAEVHIPDALQGLAGFIDERAELALSDIAEDAVNFYQQEIAREGSVDTGHFMNTVGIKRQARHERDIASDAFYSGVVRRKGSGEVIGPMFAERTISRLGPSIEDAFTRQLNR